ncbi:MAG: hypothetical protein Q4A49_04800 [Neisseria sp.]|nr:hypothetical protein [Neisseria sp.]
MNSQEKNCPSQQSNKNFSSFIIEELLAFLIQFIILFCVIVLLSNCLSNEDVLVKFAESKLDSTHELFLTFLATIFALGLLTTIQKLLGDKYTFWNKIIDNTLLEFPRTIYLFGSSLTSVTASVGLYIKLHPNNKDNPTFFFTYAIFFAIVFFIYGCGMKYLLIRNTLKNK